MGRQNRQQFAGSELIQYNKMYIKASYKHQVHLIKIQQMQSVGQLNKTLQSTFKNLPQHYCLKAENVHGLSQAVLTDQDFKQVKNSDNNIVKAVIEERIPELADPTDHTAPQHDCEKKQIDLQVQVVKQNQQIVQQKIIQKYQQGIERTEEHKQQQKYSKIYCNLCNHKLQQPRQIFYYCSVCQDVYVCQKCQQICVHDHPFVKIRGKQQVQYKVFVVLQSQIQNLGHYNSQINQKFDPQHDQHRAHQNNAQKQGIVNKLNTYKNYCWNKLAGIAHMIKHQQPKNKQADRLKEQQERAPIIKEINRQHSINPKQEQMKGHETYSEKQQNSQKQVHEPKFNLF